MPAPRARAPPALDVARASLPGCPCLEHAAERGLDSFTRHGRCGQDARATCGYVARSLQTKVTAVSTPDAHRVLLLRRLAARLGSHAQASSAQLDAQAWRSFMGTSRCQPGVLGSERWPQSVVESSSSSKLSLGMMIGSGSSTVNSKVASRWQWKPEPAGMRWPMMTFSLKPVR